MLPFNTNFPKSNFTRLTNKLQHYPNFRFQFIIHHSVFRTQQYGAARNGS